MPAQQALTLLAALLGQQDLPSFAAHWPSFMSVQQLATEFAFSTFFKQQAIFLASLPAQQEGLQLAVFSWQQFIAG